jgi:3-deoxy-D-manno-octulosonate 8-phosphate phosphatase (KDO 8-P phosphatase)
MVIPLRPVAATHPLATLVSASELALRARRLRLVLSDCDGVLTDGSVYVSGQGEELKRFSLRDGMGVERLREGGVETAILTRERSPIVAARAAKLGVLLFDGVRDKQEALSRILAEERLAGAQVAYIGDDTNDLGILERLGEAGLTGAPADAQQAVLDLVHYRCRSEGGRGAFREFAEWLLGLRRAGSAA